VKRAVILLSGGLDSATTLAIAIKQEFECYALSFDYGQRHVAEINAARVLAQQLGVMEHRTVRLDLGALGGSALTDSSIAVPELPSEGIPVTYVPARNTVMLAYALAWSEVLKANDLFIGVNAVDYSGYPDCRPEFIGAFEKLANLATKAGVEQGGFRVHAPLINLTKAEIIKQGMELGLDYGQTVSCYQASSDGKACGRCDSCRLRRTGFELAGVKDPTRYLD
jgi:7-cyano-7-deazaguanine synthase